MLELFLCSPHRVIPRAEVLAKVWGFTFEPHTSVVEIAVSRVRRKLARVSSRVRLQTVRNVGFFADNLEPRAVSDPAVASPNASPRRRIGG